MTDELALQLKTRVRGRILFDEPMALHTSLKVGGPAACFALPADIDDLQHLVLFLFENRVPYLVIGGGYNLLVRDGGFPGVIISLEQMHRMECSDNDVVVVEAGVRNIELVTYSAENGLGGLEFLVGIPGTLGGALAMNAGAGGQAIMDNLEALDTLADGVATKRNKDELEFGYRFLKLAPGEIILGASFRLRKENKILIQQRIETFLEHRRQAQKVGFPNAGSFFKNPPQKAAWQLVDEAGLRGFSIGGAQISELHANFLINRGGAKSADFIELAEHIKQQVSAKTGITLEEEVKIVGND